MCEKKTDRGFFNDYTHVNGDYLSHSLIFHIAQ